jgi:uncharacterized membrane protein
MIVALAFLIGIVAGLRALTAPAAVSVVARFGHLSLSGTPFAFMGYQWTPWIFGILALAELVGDQLPGTPSRKVPVQFGTRIVMGGLAGGTIGASAGMMVAGIVAGILGAVAGTMGGAAGRTWLAGLFDRDPPAALIEDIVAIGGAILIVGAVA